MSTDFDFKKEMERTKKQLAKFSKEAVEIAKKGEKELVKFSRKSKLHIDSTALTLKKEHLYYMIGKEYIQAKAPAAPTAKLKKYLEEVDKVLKQQRALKSKMKSSAGSARKKSSSSASKTKS